MSEEFRQRSIRHKLARMEPRAADIGIPTGFPTLDAAIVAGGLPRGRIIELFGPSSCGKTTLAIQIVAHAQVNGSTAAWLDADHTFDPAYARQLGLALEDLPIAQPDSAEQALEIARQLALSQAVDLLVVDSAAALVPKLELESGIGTSGPGLHSRVMASGLYRLSSIARRSGCSFLFLNQTRAGAEGETSAGGAPLKLHAAVRVTLTGIGGKRVRFRVLKNKAGESFQEGDLVWAPRVGFVESP